MTVRSNQLPAGRPTRHPGDALPAAERWRAIVETAVDAVVSIDEGGAIQTFNPAAERLFGYTSDEVIGRNVRMLMNADVARDHDGYLRRVLDGGEKRIIGIGREVTGRHRDGSPIALHLSVGQTTIDGRQGFVGIMRDIRQEVALRDALRARDAEYTSITDAMAEGLVVQRADGTIVTSNPAAHRILGLSKDQLAGRTSMDPRWRAVDEEGSDLPGAEHPTMVTMRTGRRVERFIMGVDHASGRRVWLEVTSFPIELVGEERPGVAAVFRDTTEARESQRRLAESLGRYRALVAHLPDAAVVMFDRDLRISVAEGPVASTLLGEGPAIGELMTDIAPEPERADIEYACGRALAGDTHHQRVEKGGRVLDLAVTPILAVGEIVGGMVVAQDVTARAALEAEQAALHEIAHAVADEMASEDVLSLVAERVHSLFGAVGAAVFRWDGHGVVTVLAAAPDVPDGIRAGDRLAVGDGSALAHVLRHRRAGAVARYGDDDEVVSPLRAMGAVGGAAAPVLIGGELWGVLGFGAGQSVVLDDHTAERLGRFAELVAITIANAEEWRRLREMATVDVVTGLANRAAFERRLDEEIRRVEAGGPGLALALIDADHFKQVNDAHGHAVGDQVLATIATTLRGTARGDDLVARIGGEEFGWLMPGVGADDAVHAAGRMRRAMAEGRHPVAGEVTVSAGIAMARSGDDRATLLARADRALYAAKDRGRDQVVADLAR